MCPQLTLRLCPPCHTLRASHGTPCGTLQHAFFGWTRAASWKRQTYAAPARLLVLLSLRGDWRADFAGGGLAPAELPIRALVHPKRRPGARCVEQRVGGEDGRPGLLARAAGRNPAGDAGLFCAHTDLLGQPALADAAAARADATGRAAVLPDHQPADRHVGAAAATAAGSRRSPAGADARRRAAADLCGAARAVAGCARQPGAGRAADRRYLVLLAAQPAGGQPYDCAGASGDREHPG